MKDDIKDGNEDYTPEKTEVILTDDEEFVLPAVEEKQAPPVQADKAVAVAGRKNAAAKFFGAIKYFLVQTFRKHTGTEYSELLTRGLRSNKGVNRAYPWAYFRLFTMLFILYAVFLLIIRFTNNALFVPTVTLLGSVVFNLTFLCLLYEVYPQRDMSMISVLFAMMIGGTSACVISQALFSWFPSPNLWLKAVYVGFFEELSKTVVVVLIIVISGKRSPLAGFLFGAAVGCGFSIVEDMGYIFVTSNELTLSNLNTIIDITISRGFTAFFTHVLWTAIIGWAYSHFNRHLYNVFNYIILIAVCGLHICWDLPLSYVAGALVCAGCIVVASGASIGIIAYERWVVFRAAGIKKTDESYYRQEAQTVSVKHYLYWRHWGHFTLALGAFLMAVISVIYCSIPFRETYGTETFSDAQSFVTFMQDGRELTFEENRAYNPHDTQGDKDKTVTDGVLTSVTQVVNAEGVKFDYVYNVAHDELSGNNYYLLTSVYVWVDGIKYVKEDVYNSGKLYASYFHINKSVTGYNFESDGDVTVFIFDANFVRDFSQPRYAMLFYTFAGIFFISMVCFVGLEIKSRRVKKLCSTTTAYSAK